jgi:hypothetical protein
LGCSAGAFHQSGGVTGEHPAAAVKRGLVYRLRWKGPGALAKPRCRPANYLRSLQERARPSRYAKLQLIWGTRLKSVPGPGPGAQAEQLGSGFAKAVGERFRRSSRPARLSRP